MSHKWKTSQNYAGSPVSVLVPDFIGQLCYDTSNNRVYVATGLTNTNWVLSTSGSGSGQYVSRGDITGFDLGTGSFTKNSAWHELDLSGIIPAEARGKLLHIRADILTTANGQFFIMNNSYSTSYGIDCVSVLTVANIPSVFTDLWVKCDANGKVQYNCLNGTTWTTLNVAVRGYVL